MKEKEKQEISEKYYGELGYFTRYYADEMIIHDGIIPDYYPSPINKIGTDETDYPIIRSFTKVDIDHFLK